MQRPVLPFPALFRALCLVLPASLLAGTAHAAGEPQAMSALGAYLAGGDAVRQSDYGAAADFLAQALKADPDNVELLRNMVMVVVGQGKQEDAVALARRLAAQDKQSPIANLVLALADVRSAKLNDADAALAALPRAGINNLLVPLARGWIAAGKKDAAAADEALKPLGDITTFASLYQLHRGLIADFLGNRDQAAEAYKAVTDVDPVPSWRTVSLIGGFEERRGDGAAAKALYDGFQERNPDSQLLDASFARLKSGQKPPPPVANAAQGIGEALFDIGSVIQRERPGSELAMVYTRLAAWMRPDSAMIKMLLGDVLETENRLPEAIAVFKSIDAKSPFSWAARQHVALGRDAEGDTEGAIAELKAMAAEQPGRIESLADLGDLLRNKQRFAEAVTAYDQAIQRLGKAERRHWSLFFDRGIAEDRSKQKDKAETDLQKALELEPEQPYVLNYLGYSWVDEGKNLDRAKQMIARAVELRPQDGEIVDSLGWANYRLGDYPESVKHLERAVELRPQDATINDHLGDAYWQVGRKIEAQFQWRRALALDTENELRDTIEKKLANGLPAKPAEVPPTAAKP
jgi:tetratricopeptide (TPR) repeat protein